MTEKRAEESELRSVTLENAQRIFQARRRAEAELLRAKEDLTRQSEWFRVTLASIGDGVITTDLDGKVISLNAVAENLTGWTHQAAAGQPLEDVFRILNEDTKEPVENPALKALREGRAVGLANHTILVSKDGTRTPIDDSAAPIRDEAGRVYGVILIFRSIADRRMAQKAMKDSERELSDFFENSSVALHWAGPDGTILRANRTELDMLGYAPEEYIGHHITEFNVDPDNIEDIFRRLAAGETVRDREAQLRCKDGTLKHVLIDSSVLWQNGQFVHTRCFTRDITDRKQAEEARARLAAIVESSHDAIISKTLQGRIASWNAGAEHMFGYGSDEAIGQPITIIIPQERHDEERMILDRLRRGERIEHYETVRIAKDGRRLDVSLSISPVRDGSGRIIGASKISRDISARKRAEQRLATQNSVTRFLAESDSLSSAAPQILQAICDHQEWQLGALWCVDKAADVLRSADLYYQPSIEASHFEQLSRERTFERGVDLPGRIWTSGRVAWIPDVVHDKNFPRAPVARGEGLHSAFGFPITLNGNVLGVMEFFSPEIRQPDPDLLVMMGAIGSQVGQFIERRQAETAQRTSEARKSAILDTALDSIITCDHSGHILEFNPAAEATFGFTGHEVLGRDLTELIVPPRFRTSKRLGFFRDVAIGREGVLNRRVEMMALHADGTEFPVELAVTCISGEGPPVYTVYIRDITGRKRGEQTRSFLADASTALAELSDHRSTMQKIAALAVPFFADWCSVDLKDPDGSVKRVAITHSDPAKTHLVQDILRGPHPAASPEHGPMSVLRTGKTDWMAHIPDSLLVESARDEEHLRLVRELGLKSFISTPLRSRSRTLGALTFATAESGRVYDTRDVAAAEDLARRASIAIENANLLATLKETDRRKDEFLAMLAHELRNPLAPIHNAVQIYRRTAPPSPDLKAATEVIDRQVHQLTRLVDDLLDVSRITRGKVELRKEPVELTDVLNSALEASRPLIEENEHELTVEIPPESILLDADPTRLAQVFLNLLNNAAKYTDRGGHIELTVTKDGDHVAVGVKDNGIGISPDMLPRVFDLFAQVDRSMERTQGGLGIGLTLVQRLVAMHGGTVEAHSQGAGAGSEFVVRLPVATYVELQSSSGGRPSTVSPARRILIVDDNRDAADSLALLLRMVGNHVQTANDGLGAVQAVADFHPEVVLLDIGLPKLNGYEAARHIREQKGGAKILLIALTGWSQEEDRRRSREAGFDHHLNKPVEFGELQELLAHSTRPPAQDMKR